MPRREHHPLVSAIITTYNRNELLTRAIDSVASQTYPAIELVVVDDCSPESAEPVVAQVDERRFERVRFYRHERNRGVSAARNTGIAESTGELIAFLDDDDIWDRSKIEKQVSTLRQSDRVGAVYTGVRSVDSTGSTIMVQKPTREGNLTKDLLCGFNIWMPTLLVERDVIDEAGTFDEDILTFEDPEWVARLSQQTRFKPVSEPLYITLRGDEHAQLSDDLEIKIRNGYPQLMNSYQRIASDYNYAFRIKVAGYGEYNIGYAALAAGRTNLARRCFLSAITTWPLAPRFYLYFFLSLCGQDIYLKARNAKRWTFDQFA